MQLSAEILPYYQSSFSQTYPRLARRLELWVPDLVSKGPPLYTLTEHLEEILGQAEDTEFGRTVEPRLATLRALHDRVQAALAEWSFEEADRLLYQMEDLYDEIDADLSA
jgi:hypothetical protein